MPHSKKSNTIVAVVYTETAVSTSEKIADYLEDRDIDPNPILADLIAQFEAKVKQFTHSCPISPELEKLGCTRYRQFNSDKGYRLFYDIVEVDTEVKVFAHAILGPGQDIQQLLFARIIERD